MNYTTECYERALKTGEYVCLSRVIEDVLEARKSLLHTRKLVDEKIALKREKADEKIALDEKNCLLDYWKRRCSELQERVAELKEQLELAAKDNEASHEKYEAVRRSYIRAFESNLRKDERIDELGLEVSLGRKAIVAVEAFENMRKFGSDYKNGTQARIAWGKLDDFLKLSSAITGREDGEVREGLC